MPIISMKANRLERIREKSFKTEKEIQNITKANLGEIFGLELVDSEVTIGNLRMDTLAFNNETKSFTIIEYKRDKKFSVIDQGYAYLSLLLNNKADIILEYNERMSKSLRRDEVDWSQSRVLFVSPGYTVYQRQAIGFKDLPIEIWEIKRYDNDTILYSQIKVQESALIASSQQSTVTRSIRAFASLLMASGSIALCLSSAICLSKRVSISSFIFSMMSGLFINSGHSLMLMPAFDAGKGFLAPLPHRLPYGFPQANHHHGNHTRNHSGYHI